MTLGALANDFVSNGTILATITALSPGELNFTLRNSPIDGAISVNPSSSDIVVNDSFSLILKGLHNNKYGSCFQWLD